MDAEDFSKEAWIKISLGHLLVAWDVVTEKFSDLHAYDGLKSEEVRAIWGLADLLEKSLIENGVTERHKAEWETLIGNAKKFMRTVPVDFLN